MKFSVSPVVAALSTGLFVSGVACADGGAHGVNGESQLDGVTVLDQRMRSSHGAAGTEGTDAEGKDGLSMIDQPAVTLSDVGLTGSPGGQGGAGGSDEGAGGEGGVGGGTVFGGMSSGGAGGKASVFSFTTTSSSSAAGGSGGNVSGNHIVLKNATLIGERGGSGGLSDRGGGGAGGLGGGSVFGGLSSGGAGGNASSETLSFFYSSLPADSAFSFAVGGAGGDVTGHHITLSTVTLTGAKAGIGGEGAGAGGMGGGSVFGGLSRGAAGGHSYSTLYSAAVEGATLDPDTNVITESSAKGGAGGESSGHHIRLRDARLTGAAGGKGGATEDGGGGVGGEGGGSVFGGVSHGGAGGYSYSTTSTETIPSPLLSSSVSLAEGGNGGGVSGNRLRLRNVILTGAKGGAGGGVQNDGGSGAGALGGGLIFGGMSSGGVGGYAYSATSAITPMDTSSLSSAQGGDGGGVSGNILRLSDVTLTGAKGGAGGRVKNDGGSGSGGVGGGSVFGGMSSGGAGGYARAYTENSALTTALSSLSSSISTFAEGGKGGVVNGHRIRLSHATLTGAEGGAGGNANGYGGSGSGGLGGGSVVGGISSGGAGGYATSDSSIRLDTSFVASAVGGSGGDVSDNRIRLNHVNLIGARSGAGGDAYEGGKGVEGVGGGSIFGGISSGGAGGYADAPRSFAFASGGAGGEVSDNHITLAGVSSLTGDIYGGYSQGGAKGNRGVHGEGGLTNHNTVTLVGNALTIGKQRADGSYESGGSIYGGYSVNGDGKVNEDSEFTSFYQGNTLNLDGYSGSVKGIYHFENFNWILPKDVVNGDTLIRIEGAEAVALDHTKHSITMKDDGKRLNMGDRVILIDVVQGAPQLLTSQTIEQGHFILYDAVLDASSGQLLLKMGDEDTSGDGDTGTDTDNGEGKPKPKPKPAGRINPKAKSFLEGRSAMLAMTNHGADMVSENGIAAAQNSGNGTGLFLASAGGSSRYKTGSHIDVKDITFALGVSTGFALDENSTLTVAAFGEYGDGSYTSHNNFGSLGKVRGTGDSNYAGGGVLLHVDGLGSTAKTAINTNVKAGAHISAALRAGRTRNTFDSADMVDAEGVSGRYKSRTNYFSAMVGAGYMFSLDGQQALDFYGRYTWGRLGSDTVHIGKSALDLDSSNSSRLRVGTRYSYVNSDAFTVYGGLAFEREFKGAASGEAAGLGIDQPSFKGNTGVMELGATLKPWASQQALSVDVGVQGYVGKREGVSGSIKLGYAF